jgi:hypothetical protein
MCAASRLDSRLSALPTTHTAVVGHHHEMVLTMGLDVRGRRTTGVFDQEVLKHSPVNI